MASIAQPGNREPSGNARELALQRGHICVVQVAADQAEVKVDPSAATAYRKAATSPDARRRGFAANSGQVWMLAARGDQPEFRRTSRLFVAGTAGCAGLLAGSAFLPADARILAWGLLDAAYLAGFAAMLLTASPAVAAALIITDALIERFGLLIIIVLGEILTGVVMGLARQPINALTLSVGLVAVVVGFGAWWTYFDFAGHRPPRSDTTAKLQWMFGHLPLTAAIASMGAALVSLIGHAHDARTPTAAAWVLCAGAAIVLVATMLVAATLRAWRSDSGLYRSLAFICAAVTVACLALGALQPAPLVVGLVLVILLSIPWVFAVVRRVASDDDRTPARDRSGR